MLSVLQSGLDGVISFTAFLLYVRALSMHFRCENFLWSESYFVTWSCVEVHVLCCDTTPCKLCSFVGIFLPFLRINTNRHCVVAVISPSRYKTKNAIDINEFCVCIGKGVLKFHLRETPFLPCRRTRIESGLQFGIACREAVS